ncbi:MAG TPA: HupE/UreJ family protein [Polyangiaceae bacterium]|nr:HupE/UreJ family protein [Polyangiaceae bacterium]
MPPRRHDVSPPSARGTLRAAWAALLAGAALALVPTSADAHAIGLSRGDYRVTEQGLDVAMVFARGEALAALPSLDPDGHGSRVGGSLALARDPLTRDTIEKIRVTTAEGTCAGTLVDAFLTEQDGWEFRARYVCPEGAERLTVALPLLDDLSHGHRHAAHVTAGAMTAEHLLFRQQAAFAIDRAAVVSEVAPASTGPWGGFVRMGMEHILTGYDHLLFLFALVLAGGTLRSLALAITSFTLAHSVTLALAVLGFVAPPARWIEPAIALSVAYVGAENFLVRPRPRYGIAFLFGLVHGFGFAGALGEIAIPRADVPWALFSFNLGVEIGQLAWMVLLGFSMTRLRRLDGFGRRAVPVLSAAIVVVGLLWFVERLHSPAVDTRGVACAGDRCG